MKFRLGLSFIVLAFFVTAGFAQTDIEIKKKVTRKIPGMADLPMGSLPPDAAAKLKKMNEVTTTTYVRASQMRTDTTMNVPTKTGGFDQQTFSNVIQYDKQRLISSDTKSKKYIQSSLGGQSSGVAKTMKTGGFITVSGSVTDTGERAKIFGYEARRLKQSYTFTPSGNACMKEKMQIETDGWYAEMPEFSCPMKMAQPEKTDGNNCIDEYDFQITGALTGVALKEVRKVTIDGNTITTEEEATAVNKTTLPANFFEPPIGYAAGNPQSKSSANSAQNTTAPQTSATSNSSDSLSLPSAAIEKQPPGEKKTGMIRVGIAKPKVTTPESKKDPTAGDDIANAVNGFLLTSLKAENVEAVQLDSENIESEAKEKGCDYIFYANVTQKRGGGGMFKSMILQGAIMGAGMMVPGIGGMIAATVAGQVMGQTMGKMAKAKDEFTLDYNIVGMDKTVLSKGTTKKKTEKDGEDVLTPQLQQASTAVLGEIAKKKPTVTP